MRFGSPPDGRDQTPPSGGDDRKKRPKGQPMSDDELLESVARRVVDMGLAVPAVFFLESFVQAFLSSEAYSRLARLMEDRDNVELLLRKMETLDEEQRAREKQRKAEEKQRKAEEKRRRMQ